MEKRIEELLAGLSLEEKGSLTAGDDMWHTPAVPRLGIPRMKLSDGPSGARGASFGDGVSSACFPSGVCLGATWNPDLVLRVGAALGDEARSKGAHVLLGPTVNIHRSPLGGRHFECYSEDPLLTARLAVAFVRGVQSRGVAACVKHFACNDSEYERHTISSEVGERALREIYLPPFEAAVREAEAWSVMSAYNRLNGTYCSSHRWLLRELLKEEWGFDGLVVSDWFGTHDPVEDGQGGLDLEMPGPARSFGPRLAEAVREERVPESELDDKVRRLLRCMLRTGALDQAEAAPERSEDRPEHRELARRAAVEGTVLLRNEGGVLPLDSEALGSLAVIGPNAAVARLQGGGSARVRPHHSTAPLDALRERWGEQIEIAWEPGCGNHRLTPELDPRWLTPVGSEGERGFTAEYFASPDLEGDPVRVRTTRETSFRWMGAFAPEIDPQRFSLRLSARLDPPATGTYRFSLISAGRSRLFVDDKLVVDCWTRQRPGEEFFGLASAEETGEVELASGQPCALRIEYARAEALPMGGLRPGCLVPSEGDPVERAEALAARCDAAVLFVGLTEEWDTEGRDRPDLELPGRQVELIERVAAANPRTVVVLQSGGPVRADWAPLVPAILQAWYPGQECAHALADVLFGEANPSGKLPTSFPRRLEDTPAFLHYPGERGRVEYGEGVFVGYRWYDTRRVEPLFPFGHGLSYTRFAYGDLCLAAGEYELGEPIEVSLELTNAGERAGQEVVQLYVRDTEASVARPEQELRAFRKVALAPGERATVRFVLEARDLSFWDPERGGWLAEPGEFELRAGSSSRDLRAWARFTLRA